MKEDSKWEEIRSSIEKVDKQLFDALDAFYERAPVEFQSKLRAMRVRYPYGKSLLSEGVPRLPNGASFDADFIVSGSLPLGIITSGSLDVIDGSGVSASRDGKPPMSLAQLKSGDLVGIFEALDIAPEGVGQAFPDWTIYSGINSIQPLEDITTAGRYNSIKREIGISPTRNDIKRKNTFGQKIYLMRDNLSFINTWMTEIIFLNKVWFESLFESDLDEEIEIFALRARDNMRTKAWHAVTHTRNIHSSSLKYFYPSGNMKIADRRVANSAYRLFVALVDVATGRRPFFVFDCASEDLAPILSIQEGFLKKSGMNGGLLRPAFASAEHPIGYLPFHYLLPELMATPGAAANSLDAIDEGLSKIEEAADSLPAAEEDGKSVPFLRRFSKLKPCLAAKVPAERGEVKYRKFEHNGKAKSKITTAEFFSEIPGQYNPHSSKIFNYCMRFDLSNFEWN